MASSRESFGTSKNAILTKLSELSLDILRPHLKGVELEIKDSIYKAHQAAQHVYFVEAGMISVVSVMHDGGSIEVGTIGKEGMAGAFLLLGTTNVPYQHFVQIAGFAYRMDAKIFMDEAEHTREFRGLILRYQAAFHTQTMQTAACNGLHSVAQRCCRWILMSRDRVDSDIVPLTHEFLGIMLGVRRASVTEVFHRYKIVA